MTGAINTAVTGTFLWSLSYLSSSTTAKAQRPPLAHPIKLGHGFYILAMAAHALHDIQRLMVIGNFCLLTEMAPQPLDEWYLGVYVDAIE